MKKIVFLLSSILLLGFASINAQDFLKFNTFDFYKGLVSIEQNHYTSFSFCIKAKVKDRAAVQVGTVLVEGELAEFSSYTRGAFTFYTVEMPSKTIISGTDFNVEIFFKQSGFMKPSRLSATGIDPNDGGPGGGADPTVIIIKYP